jgi:hypothetical protein
MRAVLRWSLSMVLMAGGAPAAGAATITVDSGGDALAADGVTTLREALLGALSGDVIAIAVPAVTLTRAGAREDAGQTGDLDVAVPVTIRGGGATIDGAGLDRVFDVRPGGALTLEDAKVTGGAAPDGAIGTPAGPTGTPAPGPGGAGEGGGGIRAAGPLTLRRVTVSGNRAGAGGTGAASIRETAAGAGGRGGDGGGILATGEVTLTAVTVSGNAAGNGGAGGAATTFVMGEAATAGAGGAGGDGGGLSLSGGPAAIADSTIADDHAGNGGAGGPGTGAGGIGVTEGSDGTGGDGGPGGHGGGVNVAGDATVTLDRSLLARDTAGAGGVGGAATGGNGGSATGPALPGGAGGAATGGHGGAGGRGGGLATSGAGGGDVRSTRLSETTVVDSTAGAGGAGGEATGGNGGFGSGVAAFGGDGGDARAGTGGDAGRGGGLAQRSGPALSVRGSTVAGNTAPTAGGAPGASAGGIPGGTLSPGLPGASVPGDAGAAFGGGGIAAVGAGAVAGSIVASNAPDQCLHEDAQTWVVSPNLRWPADGDVCGADWVGDPKLTPLAARGGATETMGLGPGSAAIDGISANGSSCDTTDARGVVRPIGGICDAGAYEVAPAVVVATGATAVTATTATLQGTVDTRRGATTVHAEWDGGASAGVVVPAGTDPAAPVSIPVAGLTAQTTYTYDLVAVGQDGDGAASASFTTSAPVVPPVTTTTTTTTTTPPPPPATTTTPPRTTTPPTTTPTRRAPVLSKVRLSATTLRRGKSITISWTDSAAVKVTIRFARRSGKRWIAVKGTLTHADKAGSNRLVFKGRLAQRTLAAGTYRLTLTPAGGRAVTRTLTIARR